MHRFWFPFFSFFCLYTFHEYFLILISFLFVLFLLFFLSPLYSRIRATGEGDNEKKEWELLGWREILLEQSYSLMLPAGLFLHQKYLNVSVARRIFFSFFSFFTFFYFFPFFLINMDLYHFLWNNVLFDSCDFIFLCLMWFYLILYIFIWFFAWFFLIWSFFT